MWNAVAGGYREETVRREPWKKLKAEVYTGLESGTC